MQGSFDKQSEIEFLQTEGPRFISTIPIKLHSGKEHQLRSARGLRVVPTLQQLQPGNQASSPCSCASWIDTVVSFLICETALSNTATPTSSLLPAARGSQGSVLELNGGHSRQSERPKDEGGIAAILNLWEIIWRQEGLGRRRDEKLDLVARRGEN